MDWTLEPLHADLGVRVTGIDMSAPRDAATVAAIRDLVDRYSFVLFPEQASGDEAQMVLTREIGAPEPSHTARADGNLEYFGTIGNVQPDGSTLGNADRKTVFLTGNNMWHSDASFKPVPAFASIMSAYETPDEGGETLFVSLRAAYERLSDGERDKADPLIGIHDYVYSRSKVAPDAVHEGYRKTLPPVRQRLVRQNPATGARNLFLGSHVREIEGWGYDASRPYLDALTEAAVADANVYAHRWQPGDLVIWDNRCLLHRGAGYDADRYRRYMRQTRVSGVGSSLEEAA